MTTTEIPAGGEVSAVIGGVDTHVDTHTAAVLDDRGRLLDIATFAATGEGYAALTTWLVSFGQVAAVGVEGTGAYGAGLSLHLAFAGITVCEVNRPDRAARRLAGKSDPVDAEAAARAVLAGAAAATPKDHHSERGELLGSLRVLRVARRSAVDQRGACSRQIKTLLITAPEALRACLRPLSDRPLVATCAALRPDISTPHGAGDPVVATKVALRALARRHVTLIEEILELEKLIATLVKEINPRLTSRVGVGADAAGQLLVTAGANCERMRTEGAFAMLCGVAPLPAPSGRTRRHRLNRGGDRQANAALHRVALTRMRWEERTQGYFTRPTAEGLSKREMIRCLKRLIAREMSSLLRHPHPAAEQVALAA